MRKPVWPSTAVMQTVRDISAIGRFLSLLVNSRQFVSIQLFGIPELGCWKGEVVLFILGLSAHRVIVLSPSD